MWGANYVVHSPLPLANQEPWSQIIYYTMIIITTPTSVQCLDCGYNSIMFFFLTQHIFTECFGGGGVSWILEYNSLLAPGFDSNLVEPHYAAGPHTPPILTSQFSQEDYRTFGQCPYWCTVPTVYCGGIISRYVSCVIQVKPILDMDQLAALTMLSLSSVATQTVSKNIGKYEKGG